MSLTPGTRVGVYEVTSLIGEGGMGQVDDVGLSKVSVRGGQPQIIYRWPGTTPVPTGFSWGPDDAILFGTASGHTAGRGVGRITRGGAVRSSPVPRS